MVNNVTTSTNKCLVCGKAMESDWKFCPNCREKHKRAKCLHCKKEINAHWNFCPFCQKSLKVKAYVSRGLEGNEWIKQVLKTS